jgi:hypothetical protein
MSQGMVKHSNIIELVIAAEMVRMGVRIDNQVKETASNGSRRHVPDRISKHTAHLEPGAN